jgi:starch synthase (maltosyl-transferring)
VPSTKIGTKPAGTGLNTALAAPRIVIDRVSPCIDCGRYPAKGVVGHTITIEADIFIDGHDVLGARVLWRAEGMRTRRATPLQPLANDRWRGAFTPSSIGLHRYTIEAWLDEWGSFRSELLKKYDAGMPTHVEILQGRTHLRHAAAAAKGPSQQRLHTLTRELADCEDARAIELLLSDEAAAVMRAVQERRFATRLARELEIVVERRAAAFASWYELFPRSQTSSGARHGTFDGVIARLPAIQAMGFDVLYLTPIHPIGRTYRKGRNNSMVAAAEDPGSPYAIGAAEGGHEAVHPELGGIEAFRRLMVALDDYGMELALDFALQCSPDHPWLRQHPGWFVWRPDGSIRHAENPPKKYEDIVNVDFYAPDAEPALWLAWRDVIEGWIGEGVKIFRIDNPHTKPLPFWEWLIADIRARHPEVIFLSEAFTRPALMYRLAKLGFSQSYTYFTWRNSKEEITDYFTELTAQAPRDFFRPHLFVNTPDINPLFLQSSGRPGFVIRAALAATLSGLWGLYSGFELCEAAALPHREEYLDSEKYQIKPRNWTAPGNIIGEIARLNHIRRNNPALQTHHNLKFYNVWNDQVLYYGKATPDRSNFVLIAVSLDPLGVQETQFEVPLWEFGLPDEGSVEVEELMRGQRFTWYGKIQHWRFVPQDLPLAIFRVRPALRPADG